MAGAKSSGRERHNMILIAMADVADRSTRLCAYEDIVVRAWQLFPQEFGLRGYVDKYPDSSDLHKPLYGPLKRDGYVRVQNKKFGLTEAGIAAVDRLREPVGDAVTRGRLRRDEMIEIERLGSRAAVSLVAEGRAAELLDTDLYDFYGVTVRTKPADFAGSIANVDRTIETALALQDPSLDQARVSWIAATRDALKETQAALIVEMTAAGTKLAQIRRR